jgi:hypothetical protein
MRDSDRMQPGWGGAVGGSSETNPCVPRPHSQTVGLGSGLTACSTHPSRHRYNKGKRKVEN